MISFKCGSKLNIIFAPLRNVGKSKTIRNKILRRAVVARVITCVPSRASQAVKSRGSRACLGAFLLFGSFYISRVSSHFGDRETFSMFNFQCMIWEFPFPYVSQGSKYDITFRAAFKTDNRNCERFALFPYAKLITKSSRCQSDVFPI